MTCEMYRKILSYHLVLSARRLCRDNFIFQQHNDPKHTIGLVQEYLTSKKIDVMKWPAQTPDLSPVRIYGLNSVDLLRS